jgi:Fic family protein
LSSTDPNLLCSSEEKAAIETRNGVAQLDYLTKLVNEYKACELRESHVLELQAIAIEGIYNCGGRYRDARSRVTISGSDHVLPEAALVPGLVRDAIEWINQAKIDGVAAFERAAYALWRFNWIHPFRGGNGRTSRAIAYLITCMDMKGMLPGVPTLPTLIYDRRVEYVAALQAADASLRRELPDGEEPKLDLSVMTAYLRDLVMMQMASAIDDLSSSRQ